MKRNFLLMLLMTLLPLAGWAQNVAKIGTTEYPTLQDAIDDVPENGTAVITLLGNVVEGAGFQIPDTRKAETLDITIDFANYTYNFTNTMVGSANTKYQWMHFAGPNNKLTLKNGKITSAEAAPDGLRMMMQNYCSLTIDNMDIDCSNIPETTYPDYSTNPDYAFWSLKTRPVFNFNSGTSSITNSEITFRNGDDFGLIIDENGNDGKASVTLSGTTTVFGNVTVVGGNGVITGGAYGVVFASPDAGGSLSVSGGKFSSEVPVGCLADGYYNKEFVDEPYYYTVAEYDWSLSQTSLPYNAQNQIDEVKQCVVLNPDGDVRPDIKIYTDALGQSTPLTEVKNVGTYYIKVSMGNNQLGGLKPFKITAYTLTIGSSVTYKQIGDPDPEPKYSLIYDNAMSTEAANLIIEGLKLVRQQNPVTGIAPDPKDDKVDDQIRYYIDMNSATITGVENAENNYAIGTSSVDGILVVTKKVVNNEQFTVTVADNDLVYDGLEKRPAVTITYNNAAAGIENKDVTDQFTIGYNNNINADAYGENSGTTAEPVYAWINGEEATTNAKVTVHPKDESDYTESLMIAGQPVNGTISDKAFKIRQRDINEANLAAIDPVIFKNEEWRPEPKVSLTRNGNDDLVLVKETDFTYAYDNNIYVSEEAEVTVEAVKVDGKYSGNFWNKKNENYFTINPFKFTLKPVDNHKTLGDVDPVVSAEEGFAVTAIPAADMKDAENNTLTMPQAVEDIATWDKPVTRSEGEFVAVYDITITNAALKTEPLVEGKPLSAPSNNYRMNDEKGAFEIVFASDYYVSSKYTSREYKSQDPSVPDNGFYLYKKVGSEYVEIPATDDLYKEIAASGRIQGNQLKGQTIDGSVQAVLNGNKIEPKIVNEEGVEYDYTIDVLGEDYYQHTTGDFAETPEGILYIIPRKITILAEDKTTAFGEDYATLTYKVYNGHVDAADATKVLDGTVDVDGDGNLDNFTVNTSNQYGPNTIARFGGLASNIQMLVNQAQKPLTDNVAADIVAQNQATTTNANPNYNIKFVKGTYTVTPSGKTVFVDLAVTKNYGDGHVAVDNTENRTVTVKLGTTKETAETYEWLGIAQNLDYRFIQGELQLDEPTEVGTYGKDENFKVVAVEGELPTVINGYPVDYDGTLTINKGGEVVIAVKTLVYNYPVEPLLSFDANRVKITGATFAQIAANATEEKKFALTYTKPAVGFIKNGADIKVTFDGKPYGTPEGQVVSADDWAWVANYTKVTVKSGTLKVTAPVDITLNNVSFQGKFYDETKDTSDDLIRDYAGTKVRSITVIASEQDVTAPEAQRYTLNKNQWYPMVLPFEATPRQIQQIFNGFVSIDRLKRDHTASKTSEILFSLSVDNVPANEPFLAKTDLNFVFKPTTILSPDVASIDDALPEGKGILIEYPVDEDGNPAAAAVEDSPNGNQFIGTYQKFTVPNATEYSYFSIDGSLHPATDPETAEEMHISTTYIRPLGAYIKVAEGNDNANVRVFIEEPDGTITAINTVGEVQTMNAEGIYNLSGQRVNKAQKGIYIKDGKKVLVK